jgi:hypothetical protein
VNDRLSDLEARVSDLADTVRRMEGRLSALEQVRPGSPAARRRAAANAAHDATVASIRSEAAAAGTTLSLLGRTLLVLAGAFVLRALTDAGTLPAWLGVALGFAYAGTWVAASDRAAADRRTSAVFHLVAAMVIGFPLLFEAATRFRLLSPVAAAAMLTAFTGVALAVAVRRRHEVLAWLLALGGVVTAIGLMAASGRIAPALAYLVLLGVATLWLGYVQDWHGVRWPVAFAADLGVLVLALHAVKPGGAEGPGTAILLQLALMALYLGSFATRTLLLDRDAVPFEMAQTAGALLTGLGGACYTVSRAGTGATALGVASIVFGLASYGVAFAFVERRHRERVANCAFYAAVGLVLVMVGTGLALPAAVLPVGWAALALAAGALARAFSRRMVAAHAATYAVAAAVASGLLTHGGEALFSPAVGWGAASGASVLVAIAMAATAWLTVAAPPRTAVERVPRLLLVAGLATGMAGLLVGWIAAIVAWAAASGASPGAVATVRTAVLVAGALLLAWLGRLDGWVEARWLAYPVLVAIGMKILVEDLPRSRPATLFLAFALYGAALIVVPRIRRRGAPVEPAGAARA